MTPAERLRKHQRALEKTQRELDRERTKLEQQEKKLVQDIKKNAKMGQMGAVKVQAKDLVRTRRCVIIQSTPLINGDLVGSFNSGTSRNSIRCGLSYKRYRCGYRYEGKM